MPIITSLGAEVRANASDIKKAWQSFRIHQCQSTIRSSSSGLGENVTFNCRNIQGAATLRWILKRLHQKRNLLNLTNVPYIMILFH